MAQLDAFFASAFFASYPSGCTGNLGVCSSFLPLPKARARIARRRSVCLVEETIVNYLEIPRPTVRPRGRGLWLTDCRLSTSTPAPRRSARAFAATLQPTLVWVGLACAPSWARRARASPRQRLNQQEGGDGGGLSR